MCACTCRRKSFVLSGTAAWAVVAPQASSQLGTVGIVLVVAFLVLSLVLHEVAHGWVAWKRGDPTAHDLGRITLNPLPHIDPFYTILMPALLLWVSKGTFAFGGAKPVPVNASRLRSPLRDMSLVAAAGPLTNFVIAVLFAIAYKLALEQGLYFDAAPDRLEREGQLLPMVLFVSLQMNILLAVFNLVPIPPLDGSRVMTALLPDSLRAGYLRLESIGLLIIMSLLIFVPQFNSMLGEATSAIMRWLGVYP